MLRWIDIRKRSAFSKKKDNKAKEIDQDKFKFFWRNRRLYFNQPHVKFATTDGIEHLNTLLFYKKHLAVLNFLMIFNLNCS